MTHSGDFDHALTHDLALTLTRRLVDESSLNEYLETTLPIVAAAFGTERILLVDYREQTDHFDLLHFEGYPRDSVYKLRRRFDEMDLERALRRRRPFVSRAEPGVLCVPLYFSDILEAVLVLEGPTAIELTPARSEVARLLGRFLGLLMSSARLKVNREQIVDVNDLQRAREIQLSFLPREAPGSHAWELYGRNSSSSLVGGDYYDFFSKREGSVQCILADACGHGMAAALIMSNFRGLLQTEIQRRKDFAGLFDYLNQSVHFDSELIQYLTSVFLDFDEETRRLRYFNAGHFDPLVLDDQGRMRTLPGGGPPLGMFKGSTYNCLEAQLAPGDLVVLFTDGLVDIEDTEGNYFGLEGLTEVLKEYRERPLHTLTNTVMEHARDFTHGQKIEDDVTLFLMRVS